MKVPDTVVFGDPVEISHRPWGEEYKNCGVCNREIVSRWKCLDGDMAKMVCDDCYYQILRKRAGLPF